MPEHIELMFTDLEQMLKKLKKPTYEENMKTFRDTRGHFIDEMISIVKASDDREEAAREVAASFAEGVFEAFSVRGKMNGRKQADLNFFMIYYVFPAIQLTEEDCAVTLCDAVRDAWNTRFTGTNINYTTYEKLYGSFRNKIFGIF